MAVHWYEKALGAVLQVEDTPVCKIESRLTSKREVEREEAERLRLEEQRREEARRREEEDGGVKKGAAAAAAAAQGAPRRQRAR